MMGTVDSAHTGFLSFARYNMRQHLNTHRSVQFTASKIYEIDEDLRGFFLTKVSFVVQPY